MKYPSNFIRTKNSEVDVGKQYQYCESLPRTICDVTVIEDKSNEEYVCFVLRVDRNIAGGLEVGYKFEFGYAREFARIAFSGMARLFDLGEYV